MFAMHVSVLIALFSFKKKMEAPESHLRSREIEGLEICETIRNCYTNFGRRIYPTHNEMSPSDTSLHVQYVIYLNQRDHGLPFNFESLEL